METFEGFETVDLFAGPGGWDTGMANLGGPSVIGIEWDAAACQTRRAAGHATLEGDIRSFAPEQFPDATGLIASPSCQSFSMAGKGAGRKALDDVLAAIEAVSEGVRPDTDVFGDPRTGLVLEPLWWVVRAHELGRPYRWLAFEQVVPVLPVWQAYAQVLERLGYRTAVGKVSAEQYGVPQTRKRAVLLARLDADIAIPAPTHSAFYPRDPSRLDPGVLPWVSMAVALGWDESVVVVSNYGTGGDPAQRGTRTGAEPSSTVTSKVGRNKVIAPPFVVTNNRDGGGDTYTARQTVTSKTSAWRLSDEMTHLVGTNKVSGEDRYQSRSVSEPAMTVTSQARSYRFADTDHVPVAEPGVRGGDMSKKWWPRPSETPPVYVNGNQDNAARRSADQPAPTVHFGARANDVRFIVTGQRPGSGEFYQSRPLDHPAPAVTSQVSKARYSDIEKVSDIADAQVQDWPFDRPATPVQCDYRVAAPGRRERDQGERQFDARTVKVTVEQAAALQTFPANYPWSGSKTKQFEQVGNAVPPLLAQSLLSACLS